MTRFIVCVPYYSRPDFPSECDLIESDEAVPRDILLCNPSNGYHIESGMQYDPNIENGEYRMCSPGVRRGLAKRHRQYDDLYIVFRTRYFRLDGSSTYLVTGFYRIKKDFSKEGRDGPMVLADESHFVRLSDSVNIDESMKKSKAYRARFNSENSKWRIVLDRWLDQLVTLPSITSRYVDEIVRLKKLFGEHEFTGEWYPACRGCPHNTERTLCPLMKRKKRFTVINNPPHYMESLDSFYSKHM